MVTLGDYLLVSGILFSIGFAGVMLRRNLIIILMSLELMLNAANLSLVAFSRFRVDSSGLPNYNAQVFVFSSSPWRLQKLPWVSRFSSRSTGCAKQRTSKISGN